MMSIATSHRARDVLSNGAVLKTVLKEQDSSGLWKTQRGGCASDGNPSWCWFDELTNIGLHTFVVERLLVDWSHLPQVRLAAIKGLRVIVDDAVEYHGQLLWRWLKSPTQQDYLYMPDYDDTSRSVAAICVAKEILSTREFEEAVPDNFISNCSSDLAKLAIADLCKLDSSLRPSMSADGTLLGVPTFLGGLSTKQNNTIDPVVNANILYALAMMRGQTELAGFEALCVSISNYLKEVVKRSKVGFADFSRLSDYYLSPCLFAYLCSHIIRVSPAFLGHQTINDLARAIADFINDRYLAGVEAAWALVVLGSANWNDLELMHKLAASVLDGPAQTGPNQHLHPIYQHKRLRNVFGSNSCSILFSLEGLKHYVASVSAGDAVDGEREGNRHA